MKRSKLLIISLAFLIIYSSISLINHLLFRTAALDLGLYTNALYDYSHFQWNDSSLFKSVPENLLSDHFDLMLMLLSPFSLIFGSYTLLIIQIVALIFGGWGIYFYLKAKNLSENICVFGMVFFYFYFANFSALSNDFHSKVLAASLIPWLFLLIEKGKLKKGLFIFLLIIICQESISLWMGFVLIGMAYLNRKNPKVKILLAMSVYSFIYFYWSTVMMMPGFSPSKTLSQFKYSILGENYSAAFKTLFTEPGKVFHALFYNHTGDPMGDYVKSECWLFLLFSGGVLLLMRPIYLFMLIPVLFQKFLHNQVQMWGVNDQYVIEFAPIVTLGVIDCISSISNSRYRKILTIIVLIFSIGTTIRLMDRTSAMVAKSKIRIYQSAHWKSNINLSSANKAISLIPKDAIVSAQCNLVPHLALRDNCYALPVIKNAEYVIYIKAGNPYPLNQKQYDFLTDSLQQDKLWKTIFSENDIYLLKRE